MSLKIKIKGDENAAMKWVAEGKRLLFVMKSMMSIFGTKTMSDRRSYNNGTTISVYSSFGQDFINIVTVPSIPAGEKEEVVIKPIVLFLYTSADSYAVFEIEDKGATIKSYNYNISKFCTDVILYDKQNPSVVKSNVDKNQHSVMVETQRLDLTMYCPGYLGCWPQYGRHIEDDFNIYPVSCGLSNEWIGENFDTDTSYLSNPVGDSSDFICSSKHPSYIDAEGRTVANLFLDKTSSSTGDITYTLDGVDMVGDEVEFSEQRDIYAVLSPTKFIGVNKNSFTYINYRNEGTSASCSEMYITSEIGNQYSYIFGAYTLEQWLGEYMYWYTAPKTWSGYCCYGYSRYYHQNYGNVVMLDYDNLNIDESFVCIYLLLKNIAEDYEDDYQHDSITGWTAGWQNVLKKEYKLAFKYKNSGVVNTSEITSLRYGERLTTVGSPPCFNGVGPNEVVTDGNRISGVSTAVTEQYLAYTYTIWEYTGPIGEYHSEDIDDTYFTFSRRVLGIIDNETGLHTKHYIDDSNLGSYASSFDEQAIAALGFHDVSKA